MPHATGTQEHTEDEITPLGKVEHDQYSSPQGPAQVPLRRPKRKKTRTRNATSRGRKARRLHSYEVVAFDWEGS